MRVHFYLIVVSYNPGDRLKDTLDSIYTQDYRDYSVIIEDSESEDGALASLKERGYFEECLRAERTRIYVKRDNGIYDGMNLALERIENDEVKDRDGDVRELLLFLNCGDLLHDKQVLGVIADHAVEKPDDSLYIYYGDQYDLKRGTPVSSNRKLDEFALYRNIPCHQICFYDLRLFAERGYDLSYRVRADYEHFLYCIYRRSAIAEYVDVIVSDYEGGGYSESTEGRKLSEEEHRRITSEYMGRNADRYRLYLILTGAGLRRRLAESRHLSGAYNRIKSLVYRR